ncbi:MAG: hypothetical protein PHU14_13745, partial [Methylovulum sp.]|nr:hypothetical protein [Methylovulum sp.]
ARQWGRYCSWYNACNERVYFVRHDWYHREYAPRYQKFNLGNHYGGKPGHGDNDHDHGNGHGNGNGNGNGNGHDHDRR